MSGRSSHHDSESSASLQVSLHLPTTTDANNELLHADGDIEIHETVSDGDDNSSICFRATILTQNQDRDQQQQRLSNHYKSSILQESEKNRTRKESRTQSILSRHSSVCSHDSVQKRDRESMLIQQELAEQLAKVQKGTNN